MKQWPPPLCSDQHQNPKPTRTQVVGVDHVIPAATGNEAAEKEFEGDVAAAHLFLLKYSAL